MTEAEAVEQYRPYVVQRALRLSRLTGVNAEDLIQEGLLAVAKSVHTWRKKKGACFLTYIRNPVWWAMHKLVNEAAHHGTKGHGRKKTFAKHTSMDAETKSALGGEAYTLHDILGSFVEPADCLALRRLPAAMALLTPRERQVIRMRFNDEQKLDDVGEAFGVSRERARQLEKSALEKLRQFFQVNHEAVH